MYKQRCDEPFCNHLAITSIWCDGEQLHLCHKHNAYLNPPLPAGPWTKKTLSKLTFGELLHIYQFLTPSTKATFGTVDRHTLIQRIVDRAEVPIVLT